MSCEELLSFNNVDSRSLEGLEDGGEDCGQLRSDPPGRKTCAVQLLQIRAGEGKHICPLWEVASSC
jgi:hypothetical protein